VTGAAPRGTAPVAVLRRGVRVLASASPALRTVHEWQNDRARPRVRAWWRDAANRRRYGSEAPRLGELLWVRPRLVEHVLAAGGALTSSARVHDGCWPADRMRPVLDDLVLQTSISHWMHGASWEASGEVARMERAIARQGPIKGCRTRADVLRRCARLDAIFEEVRRTGELRTRQEIDPRAFREMGGIGVHLGPGGRLVRAENGRHRFAMAWVLDLPVVPVRVGLVHHSALPLLPQLRRR
jgi:hypothetical protein